LYLWAGSIEGVLVATVALCWRRLYGIWGSGATTKAESSEITSIMSSTLLREEKARIIDLGLIVRGGEAVAVELFLSNTMAECGLQ
jgi:hypothetical protein